ncbi:MAG: preprotein translocase subunit SecA [Flavobacteriales bacterium]
MGTVNTVLKKLFGDKQSKDIKALQPLVDRTNEEFEKLQDLSNDELRAKTSEFKERIREGIREKQEEAEKLRKRVEESPEMEIEEKENIYQEVDNIEKEVDDQIEKVLEEILPQAFAVVKETASRFFHNESLELTATDHDRDLAAEKEYVEIRDDTAIWYNEWDAAGKEVKWDMIHYDVQLMGGIALHQGKIAEMQTGEGKTLVATLPLYLNALPERGSQLVTVNDYLARRDAEWMGPLFEFHQMRVDCIDRYQPNSPERKAAYQADVTYGTNNEYGFDHLRDNMAGDPEDLVQRKHHYAIVDEVDSVLIDDARTPLLISGPTSQGNNEEQFNELKPKVETLVKAQQKLVNQLLTEAKEKLKQLNDPQADRKTIQEGSLALLRAYRGLPKNKALIKYLSEPGVQTQLTKTENFYLQDSAKEMRNTVDPELYFVIEEKLNSIELKEKGIELITEESQDPNFYIMPDIGAEIAKLDQSEVPEDEKQKKKDELMQDHAVKAERIHTIDQLLKAYTMFEKDVDYVIMDKQVKIVDEQTGRVLEGRRYSDGLHQAIESKENVQIEASTQTYASITLQNYFRKYHKLAGMTGTAETEAGEFWNIYSLDVVVVPTHETVIREDKEDLVFKTQREKFNAVIEEIERLQGIGRPVLVGTTSVEVSELLSRMLNQKKIQHNVLNAKRHQQEADIVAQAGQKGTVTIATNMAGRGTDIKLGDGVREAGGLAILGTERHDARRVDRQLRGRAGRQGDPGSSQFFVSLEDRLMRLFGSERISKIMDRMGIQEGEVITHSMITKSIERAQRKVEENNFGTRKKLLEYDDVMNSQREVIYTKRRHALFGERLKLDVANIFKETCENLVQEYQDAQDYEGFKLELLRVLSLESPFEEQDFLDRDMNALGQELYQVAWNHYQHRCERLAEQAYPVIKNVYEEQGDQYQNIVVPFTDGLKEMKVVADLKKAYDTEARSLSTAVEKSVILATIDDNWKEHLREMDDLRQSVQQSAQYEQKDPVLIYKFESFNLFQNMLLRMNKEISSFLVKSNLPASSEEEVQDAEEVQQESDLDRIQTSRDNNLLGKGDQEQAAAQQQEGKPEPVTVDKKPGRNEPCPCGSGKKYKHCHGKPGSEGL